MYTTEQGRMAREPCFILKCSGVELNCGSSSHRAEKINSEAYKVGYK